MRYVLLFLMLVLSYGCSASMSTSVGYRSGFNSVNFRSYNTTDNLMSVAQYNQEYYHKQYRQRIPQNTPYTPYYYYDDNGKLQANVYTAVDCSSPHFVRLYITQVMKNSLRYQVPWLVDIRCPHPADFKYWQEQVRIISKRYGVQ